MAHHVERLVEAGELKDTPTLPGGWACAMSHVSHLMALVQLSPELQEAILLEHLLLHERVLRPIARLLLWAAQRAIGAA